jgi:hypothetical protein
MELTKKQLIELVQFATGKIHSSFTWEDEAEDTVDEYLKAINYTHCCKSYSELLSCKCGLPKRKQGIGFSCMRTDCDANATT